MSSETLVEDGRLMPELTPGAMMLAKIALETSRSLPVVHYMPPTLLEVQRASLSAIGQLPPVVHPQLRAA